MPYIIISEKETPRNLCCKIALLFDQRRSKEDQLQKKDDSVSQNKVQILIQKGLCPIAPHLSLNKFSGLSL